MSNILAYVQGALQLISAMDIYGWQVDFDVRLFLILQLAWNQTSMGEIQKTVEALGPSAAIVAFENLLGEAGPLTICFKV